ncbi:MULTISPECIES: phospho-sugar mutase [Pseudonocardia]|uniref:Phosphoglucomutase n=2 Tax=Pseudonocardia TaxID=1847 RepID=A0ABQ0S5R8_9PSEU|nr:MULTISPECIES: phospho-sugar mutase [Pseudonocardia]OSY37628.1 putative phosphomannomutase [Pseudonocardia autotrophica]TDN73747.1 phosphomannomutase [Pseudonocardia autotrophica]BBG04493.1 phosphoglucomutase [Pseudonocardia autotrophica]GEC28249.1 phosphoglucomutase [Pseudonocardia saturnea]
MGIAPQLRDAALRWIADDPDPGTRAELQRLLATALAGGAPAAGAVTELADRMSGPLRFGTAGLRGPVRAGPAGMNVAVVTRTTAGLAGWLRAGGRTGTVVVGRDARHGSAAFAEAAARVLTGAGFEVALLDPPVPTPLVAFAVRQLGAVAGIAITASHNPPADNGYKVFLADGSQLVPPDDAGIEAAVTAAPAALSVPLGPLPAVSDVTKAYLDRIATLPRTPHGAAPRIALTPMHGVGGALATAALARTGVHDVHVVAAQARPDPDFPTVAFPNPEEPGATDLLLELAAGSGAALAVALDPDADRCAIGVRFDDGWRMLSGDETGVLLADHLLRTGAHPDPLVATTVVSSSMLARVAAAHGARFAETLTGFKWIVRAGDGLVFGYEEAIGLCVDPDAVRDKDGVSAAVLAADLVRGLAAAGSSVPERLDELAAAFGVHRTLGVSIRMEPAERDRAVQRLRDAPPPGWDTDRPAPDVLRLRRDGVRVVIRPSGTEPKLKAYLEVVEPPAGDPALVPASRERAEQRLGALRTEVDGMLGR